MHLRCARCLAIRKWNERKGKRLRREESVEHTLQWQSLRSHPIECNITISRHTTGSVHFVAAVQIVCIFDEHIVCVREYFDLKMAGLVPAVPASKAPGVFECICMCSARTQLETLFFAYVQFLFVCSAPSVNHSNLFAFDSSFLSLRRTKSLLSYFFLIRFFLVLSLLRLLHSLYRLRYMWVCHRFSMQRKRIRRKNKIGSSNRI